MTGPAIPLAFRVFVNEPSDDTGDSYELMRSHGIEVVLGRDRWDRPEQPLTEDELIAGCHGADAVMGVSRDRYTRGFMEASPRLRLISKVAVGVEKIDLEAATELGILVTNSPAVEGIKAVAEHAVMLMTALLHSLPSLESVLRSGGWRGKETHPSNLFGRTVGLIGYGRIGQEVAARLTGWEVTVLATDPFVNPDQASRLGVRMVTLDELLRTSDIVSVHAVATADTADLLSAREFAAMRRGAYLVNTSRGEVIDESALVDALTSGHLAGAALDVFKKEPPDLSEALFHLPNVIATPHAAGFASESVYASAMLAARNVVEVLAGRIPATAKNPAVIETWRRRWLDT